MKTPPWVLPAMATMVLVLSLILALSPFGAALERMGYDGLFFLRGPSPPPENIIVIGIDESSFQALGVAWPWPRRLHARLIEQLNAAGARTVAFDLLFAEKSNDLDDLRLSKALARHNNVWVGAKLEVTSSTAFNRQIFVMPHPNLNTRQVGALSLPLDADGVVRRLYRKQSELSGLAEVAVDHYSPSTIEPSERSGGIDFLGPGGSLRFVSYYQALDYEKYLPEGFFQDALVFVGLASDVKVIGDDPQRDQLRTPFFRWGQQATFGVEVHAQAAATMLSKTAIGNASGVALLVLATLLSLVVTGIAYFIRPLFAMGVLSVLLVTLLAGIYTVFVIQHVYVSLAFAGLPLAFGFVVSPLVQYLKQRRERRFIQTAFSSYVAPHVVKQLLQQPEMLKPGGVETVGTVLFCDLQGFTSATETMRPTEVIEMLNQQLGQFSEIIIRHGGMVDKFIGDAIMANWGVPVASDSHAADACRAALEMETATEKHQSEHQSSLAVRVGLCTGELIAGNVGGPRHINYTVLGNVVNTASRLEGVNRLYGTRIIVSEATATELSEQFILRELDMISVKGQQGIQRIFELQGLSGDELESVCEMNFDYSAALELYRQRQFTDALERFQHCSKIYSDKASHLLAGHCEHFLEHPPEENWSGEWRLTEK